MSDNKGTPILTPPDAESTSTDPSVPGSSAPAPISDAEIAALTADSTPLAGPTQAPPDAALLAGDGVTATWRNGVKIDALWSIDETRNAWVRVAGLGWRKLFNGREHAFLSLTLLAAQARQTNRPVNLREEADGMIYEIYLW
jgi:hypothetical protein